MPIFKRKNENFFRNWSPEMAYVLGFFTADGDMIKNQRGAHFVEFETTDKELLEKIRKVLGSNHKIAIRNRNIQWKISYHLQIGSKIMFQDLIRLGLKPNKSKTVKLPSAIPVKYFSHFVRGYFDGDGNVTISQYKRADRNNKINTTILSGFTSGSKNFLKNLHIKLEGLAHLKGGTLYYHDKGYRLYFSVNDSLSLYKFLYKDIKNNLYLPRKKCIFEKYFKK